MEFLLTYGWMIVIITTALMALAYFDVMDPTKWADSLRVNTCIMEDTRLSCLDHSITFTDLGNGKNDLEILLKNNMGYEINVKNLYIRSIRSNPWSFTKIIQPDQSVIKEITSINDFPMQPGFPQGEKYEFEIELEVENTESKLTHIFQGTIKGKIE